MTQSLLGILLLFRLLSKPNSPTIPAKAGIHEALIRIPAFAGMVGVGRMGKGLSQALEQDSPASAMARPGLPEQARQ